MPAGTRLAKVSSGDLDAVVLAYAGLARIGQLDQVSEVFELDQTLPAAGQGALAVECASTDPALAALIGAVDDPDSRAAVTAERAVLAGLRAGCHAPVGVYAMVTRVLLTGSGAAAKATGVRWVRMTYRGPVTGAESADLVVLAASAIESVRLALLSSFPDASGKLGRRLMMHSFIDGTAIWDRIPAGYVSDTQIAFE